MMMRTRLPRRVARRLAHTAAILAAILVVASCPNPFEEVLATQVTDDGSPVIIIDSPAEGATYQATVTITGTVTDREGAVHALSLGVPVAEVDQDVEIGEDGAFSISFSTEGISTSISFTLTATDWNGNTARITRTLENDEAGPHIQITEPEDFSAYGTVVRVSGTVTDGPAAATTDEVAGASYAVPGTSIAGDLSFGEDGTFSFEFATANPDGTAVVDGSALVEVRASDFNGNETVRSITIVKSPTGDFGSVTVTPANKQVTIEWDPVLYAEGYTIFEANYGQTQENVTSPYVWDGLENGEVYSFQVKAEIPEDKGPDAYSARIEKMPLSVRSFAPWIRQIGYRSITIEWWDNPNVETFEVERSVSPDGPWELRRRLSANVFTDNEVQHDTEYFYRVRADGFEDVVSEWQSGMAGRFTTGVVGSLRTGGFANDVVLHGDFAFVAAGPEGLVVVDLSDPLEPRKAATVAVAAGEALSVTVADNRLYVGSEGLLVFDIGDPRSPQLESTLPLSDPVWDIIVDGSLAYLANAASGLTVVDVSVATSPQHLSSEPTAGVAYDMALSGEYAFVADSSAGVSSIDLSNPFDPLLLDTEATAEIAEGIAVAGSFAYAATGLGGVVTMNVGNPSAISTVATEATCNAKGLLIQDGTLYVADGGGLGCGVSLLELTEPSDPVLVRRIDSRGSVYSVALRGAYVFTAELSDGLTVIDTAYPDTVLGRSDSAFSAESWTVDVAGDVALVGGSDGLLSSYRLWDEEAPSLLDTVDVGAGPLGSALHSIAISGEQAFIATSYGLGIVDISDAEELRLIGSIATPWGGDNVAVAGDFAYVTDDAANSLVVVDVAEPANPQVLATIDISRPYDVELRGWYLYLGFSSTISILHRTDPAAPLSIATVSAGGRELVTGGNHLFSFDNFPGELTVHDISDPDNAAPVGSPLAVGDFGYSSSASYLGDFILFGHGHDTNGISVIDVSSPSTPDLPAELLSGSYVTDLRVRGSKLYVADRDAGLSVITLWEDP